MSKYRIKLDGKIYEMDVELVSDNDTGNSLNNKVQTDLHNIAQNSKNSTPEAPAQIKTEAEVGEVAAPMPGTVIKINKTEGSVVKKGELVLILEAMKMENEISAPIDGTIFKMNCAEGSTIAGGDVMFIVK